MTDAALKKAVTRTATLQQRRRTAVWRKLSKSAKDHGIVMAFTAGAGMVVTMFPLLCKSLAIVAWNIVCGLVAGVWGVICDTAASVWNRGGTMLSGVWESMKTENWWSTPLILTGLIYGLAAGIGLIVGNKFGDILARSAIKRKTAKLNIILNRVKTSSYAAKKVSLIRKLESMREGYKIRAMRTIKNPAIIATSLITVAAVGVYRNYNSSTPLPAAPTVTQPVNPPQARAVTQAIYVLGAKTR